MVTAHSVVAGLSSHHFREKTTVITNNASYTDNTPLPGSMGSALRGSDELAVSLSVEQPAMSADYEMEPVNTVAPQLNDGQIRWELDKAMKTGTIEAILTAKEHITDYIMEKYHNDVFSCINSMLEKARRKSELCHFIHPAIIDDRVKSQIHNEIGNVVRNYPVQDICAYLREMVNDRKILLPQSVDVAMTELNRMGMPGVEREGFSYKNFSKCYREARS